MSDSKKETPEVKDFQNKLELLTVYKTESEKSDVILNNILLMLNRRVYLDKDGKNKPLFDMEKSSFRSENDNTYVIKVENGERYVLRIIYQKISITGKQSPILTFIEEFPEQHKIFIGSDYSNKYLEFEAERNQQLLESKHKEIQLFKEEDFLEDILAIRDQPKFELLTPTEMKDVKKAYNATNYTILKALKNDPVIRYLNIKKGEIYRIIRPSPTAVYGIAYRIVT